MFISDYCNATLFCTVSLWRRHPTMQSRMLLRGLSTASDATSTSHRRCVTLSTAWLPISQRITFNNALMMFDCSRGRCPKYFSDVYIPVHTDTARSRLPSADHGDIVVPCTWFTRFGCRSFRVCGPTIWSKLPQDLPQTLGNHLNVGLRAGYLSVRTAGGASDRHWMKARLTDGLTYLFILAAGEIL